MLIINETCFPFLFAHIAGYAVMGHACLVISFSLLTYFIASWLPAFLVIPALTTTPADLKDCSVKNQDHCMAA
jgi:hypothetical protein